MTVFLIRHGHAGSRSRWDGPDEKRPLSERGAGQARAVAAELADRGIDLLWTSAYLRCRQTLEPLADLLGLPIEVRDEFTEGTPGPVALEAVLEAHAAGRTVAVSSHGDVLPDLARAAVLRGAELIGPGALHKGGRFECEVVDGQIARIVCIGPPDGET
jgi:8-oxo-dGTP diphosphatase